MNGSARNQILLLVFLFLCGAFLRIGHLFNPGFHGDILHYKKWTEAAVTDGIIGCYDQEYYNNSGISTCDYPPGFIYILKAVGKVYSLVSKKAFTINGKGTTVLIKLIPFLSDLLTGILIFLLIKMITGVKASIFITSLFLLNPAIIFNSAYWGQVDSLVFLFILAALFSLYKNAPYTALVFLAFASLLKPFGYLYFPTVILYLIAKKQYRKILPSLIITIISFTFFLCPLLFREGGFHVIKNIFTQLSAMPWMSNNAHSLWGIPTMFSPLKGNSPILLGIAPAMIALFCFLAVYVYISVKVLKKWNKYSIFYHSAISSFIFFMIIPYQHENHLIYALSLIVLLCAMDKRFSKILLLLTISCLCNMVLHDPYLMSKLFDISSPEYLSVLTFYTSSIISNIGSSPQLAIWFVLLIINFTINIYIFIFLLNFSIKGDFSEKEGGLFIPAAGSTKTLVAVGIISFMFFGVTIFIANPDIRNFWVTIESIVGEAF